MIFKYLFILLLMGVTFTALSDDYADLKTKDHSSRPQVDIVQKIIEDNYLVGFSWVDAPLNRVVVLNEGHVTCAIKFTSVRRGRDSKKATTFNSGSESFYAVYEIVEKKQGVLTHKISNELSRYAAVGIGRLNFQKGNTRVSCGEATLQWSYPTGLFVQRGDKSVKFSPTGHLDLITALQSDINYNWYSYDESRNWFLIPVVKKAQ